MCAESVRGVGEASAAPTWRKFSSVDFHILGIMIGVAMFSREIE